MVKLDYLIIKKICRDYDLEYERRQLFFGPQKVVDLIFMGNKLPMSNPADDGYESPEVLLRQYLANPREEDSEKIRILRSLCVNK